MLDFVIWKVDDEGRIWGDIVLGGNDRLFEDKEEWERKGNSRIGL